MITETYVKGRFDSGKGKCAVVIVEGGEVIHQVGWVLPEAFQYNDVVVRPDQYDCEIVAVCYALKWCADNGRKAVNIYTNTRTCQKWYFRGEIPDVRVLRAAFLAASAGLDVYAENIPKGDRNQFNMLMNKLAEEAG